MKSTSNFKENYYLWRLYQSSIFSRAERDVDVDWFDAVYFLTTAFAIVACPAAVG